MALTAMSNDDATILDAQRYRWLRQQEWFQSEIDEHCKPTSNLEYQDRAIDAAMTAQLQDKS